MVAPLPIFIDDAFIDAFMTDTQDQINIGTLTGENAFLASNWALQLGILKSQIPYIKQNGGLSPITLTSTTAGQVTSSGGIQYSIASYFVDPNAIGAVPIELNFAYATSGVYTLAGLATVINYLFQSGRPISYPRNVIHRVRQVSLGATINGGSANPSILGVGNGTATLGTAYATINNAAQVTSDAQKGVAGLALMTNQFATTSAVDGTIWYYMLSGLFFTSAFATTVGTPVYSHFGALNVIASGNLVGYVAGSNFGLGNWVYLNSGLLQ